jgi:hypothetical protein
MIDIDSYIKQHTSRRAVQLNISVYALGILFDAKVISGLLNDQRVNYRAKLAYLRKGFSFLLVLQ